MTDRKIGFLGAGEMARAIAKGLIRQELVSADAFIISDPNTMAIRNFQEHVPGCRVAQSNRELVQLSQMVICAVKPQVVSNALMDLRGTLAEKLLVSIAAGVSLAKLSQLAGTERIIRVMPNTPCLIGSGASAYSRGSKATADDAAWVDQIFSALGLTVEVQESQLDAVTGLSGSGPAYVFAFIQALADGGVLLGLPRNVAFNLATETVIGAAKMLRETGDHPAVLTERVSSPGGTTIHGLAALDQNGFRNAVISAVRAAGLRSRELG